MFYQSGDSLVHSIKRPEGVTHYGRTVCRLIYTVNTVYAHERIGMEARLDVQLDVGHGVTTPAPTCLVCLAQAV